MTVPGTLKTTCMILIFPSILFYQLYFMPAWIRIEPSKLCIQKPYVTSNCSIYMQHSAAFCQHLYYYFANFQNFLNPNLSQRATSGTSFENFHHVADGIKGLTIRVRRGWCHILLALSTLSCDPTHYCIPKWALVNIKSSCWMEVWLQLTHVRW